MRSLDEAWHYWRRRERQTRKLWISNSAVKANAMCAVGYVQESPVWKTSYRLVLNGEKAPFLQGWAIVENTGDQDWDNVQLSLVSGRPISFIMDLYQPLFVARPTVAPAELAGLVPRTHDQDLVDREAAVARLRCERHSFLIRGADLAVDSAAVASVGFAGGGANAGITGSDLALAAASKKTAAASLDPSQGITTAADAGTLGELFRYNIKEPVTLAHHKSAMLPIINACARPEGFDL